jgi:hypothetical protein
MGILSTAGERMPVEAPPYERNWQRHRIRPKKSKPPLWFLIYAVALPIAILLLGGGPALWTHFAGHNAPGLAEAAAVTPAMGFRDDVYTRLQEAISDASAGNLVPATAVTQSATDMIRKARLESLRVPQDTIREIAQALDRVQAAHTNPALAEAVFNTRVELAQFRSTQEKAPAATQMPLQVLTPKSVAARSVLDPKTLSASVLDASALPEEAEILIPPHSRLFVDNVRVSDLTLEGASQTLDGIHWQNVTFVSSRIRYEGGEMELQNVRFVNCTFGIELSDKGVRLADAVALEPVSLVIE